MAVGAFKSLRASRLLAPYPLLPWRATDGVALLRNAAWALRLAGPLASHYLLVTTARPEATAFAHALGRIWQLPDPATDTPAGAHDDEQPSGALGYHGLCSLLTILTATCSLFGRCGCGIALRQTVDPACRGYTGRSGQRAYVKRGERLARHYLASRGTLLLAASDGGAGTASSSLGGASSLFGFSGLSGMGGSGGGATGGGLGAGLCSGASGVSPALFDDGGGGEYTDADDDDDDDDELGGRPGRRRGEPASSTAPSTPTRGGFPPPARSGPPRSGSACASAPGRVVGAAAARTRGGARSRGEAVWSRLLAAHGGGAAASSQSDNDTDISSEDGGGDEDGGYANLPRWAAPRRQGRAPARPWSDPPHASSEAGKEGCAVPAASRVWNAIRSAQGCGGSAAADGTSSTGEGAAQQRWCELTPFTGARENDYELQPGPADGSTSSTWRTLRAQAGGGA